MQSETAVNQHRIPIRMVKMNKCDHAKHGPGYRAAGALPLLWASETAQPLRTAAGSSTLRYLPQGSENAGPVNITPKACSFNIPEVSTKG